MNDPKPGRPRLRIGIAAVLAIGLLALYGWLETARRATGREIAAVMAPRDRLRSIADQLEKQSGEAESDRRIVMSVLSLSRSAEDIPNLGGNRVVAHHQGYEKLCFYVPAGSHTLEVTSTFKPKTKTDEPAEPMPDVWSVPLLPASGYLLKLVTDRKAGPVSWELAGNHPDFPTQTKSVLADGFSSRGSSWSGGDVIQFPNQLERPTRRQLENAAADNPGVTLLSAAIDGVHRDQPCQIKFSVRVRSETPACLSATDAKTILILGGQRWLQPYAGEGKYEIRTSPAAPATEP